MYLLYHCGLYWRIHLNEKLDILGQICGILLTHWRYFHNTWSMILCLWMQLLLKLYLFLNVFFVFFQSYSGMRPQELQEAKDVLVVETADMLRVPLFTAEALLRNHGKSRCVMQWLHLIIRCVTFCIGMFIHAKSKSNLSWYSQIQHLWLIYAFTSLHRVRWIGYRLMAKIVSKVNNQGKPLL